MELRRADEADSHFLATVILLASRAHLERGWFDVMLEQPEPECLAFIERLTRTSTLAWWHFSHFFIADESGVPTAALCCFRSGDAYPLSGDAVNEVSESLGLADEERREMWQRAAYVFSCTMESDEDTWTLENVATIPGYRRCGYAAALIGVALAEGRKRGFRRVQVTTCIGNEAAIRAYERLGFQQVEEKRNEIFEQAVGSPGLCRFERSL